MEACDERRQRGRRRRCSAQMASPGSFAQSLLPEDRGMTTPASGAEKNEIGTGGFQRRSSVVDPGSGKKGRYEGKMRNCEIYRESGRRWSGRQREDGERGDDGDDVGRQGEGRGCQRCRETGRESVGREAGGQRASGAGRQGDWRERVGRLRGQGSPGRGEKTPRLLVEIAGKAWERRRARQAGTVAGRNRLLRERRGRALQGKLRWEDGGEGERMVSSRGRGR